MIINGLEKISDDAAKKLSEASGYMRYDRTFYDLYCDAKRAYPGQKISIRVYKDPSNQLCMTYSKTSYYDKEERGFPNEKRIDAEFLCEIFDVEYSESKKVEIPIGEYTGTIDLDEDTIKVGCQTIPLTETINKIKEIMEKK